MHCTVHIALHQLWHSLQSMIWKKNNLKRSSIRLAGPIGFRGNNALCGSEEWNDTVALKLQFIITITGALGRNTHNNKNNKKHITLTRVRFAFFAFCLHIDVTLYIAWSSVQPYGRSVPVCWKERNTPIIPILYYFLKVVKIVSERDNNNNKKPAFTNSHCVCSAKSGK